MNVPQEHLINQAYREAIQQNLPFVAKEPLLYHYAGDKGYFSILYKKDGIFQKQESYPLNLLPLALQSIRTDVDSYISQNEFFKRNRRAVNLLRSNVCFTDLDVYKTEFHGMSPEAQAQEVLNHCWDEEIPEPSFITYSGQGLYAKWLLETPIPRKALPRWKAVQGHLVKRLKPFGADPKAKLASQVLRLENTRNFKTGDLVKVIWINGEKDNPIRHNFDEICNAVLPFTRGQWKERQLALQEQRLKGTERKKTEATARHFRKLNVEQLNWDRLEDLRILARLRYGNQGVQEGERDIFLFYACCFAAWTIEPNQLYYEIKDLAHEFAPSLPMSLACSYASSVLDRARQAQKGKRVKWNGKDYDYRYTPTNQRLIEDLEIEPQEERDLITIISQGEKRRRDRERKQQKRRAAGMMERRFYVGRAAKRKEQTRELHGQGKSISEIMKILQVSYDTVKGYLYR